MKGVVTLLYRTGNSRVIQPATKIYLFPLAPILLQIKLADLSRVESRVADRSSPSRVSSRRSRYQVKSQVKSIIVKSSPSQLVVRATRP